MEFHHCYVSFLLVEFTFLIYMIFTAHHTKCDAKVMFSEFLSFCSQGGWGWGSPAKKCLSPTPQPKSAHAWRGGGEGGVISQNALQVSYISIMHCSLPVISLLTYCQKEVLKACTCLYSQAARHSWILPPPPPPSGHEHFLAHSKSDIGTTAVRSEQSRFELPLCMIFA